MTDPVTRWREVAAESERATVGEQNTNAIRLQDKPERPPSDYWIDAEIKPLNPSDLGRMTQVWGDYHDRARLPSGWWLVPLGIGGGIGGAVLVLWILGVV